MKKIILPYSKVRAELNGTPMSSGSCPFSTAQVTITSGSNQNMMIICPNIVENNGGIAIGNVSINVNETKTVTVVLYNGTAYMLVMGGNVADPQGDLTEDGYNGVIVKGSGSFTAVGGIS